MPLDKHQEFAQKTRCQAVDDLSKPDARKLIWLTCDRFLMGQKICVIELLHHPRYQRAMTDAGSVLANAVQKIAIAQVKGLSEDVQDRVKFLTQLADEVVKRTWTADKEEALPKVVPGRPDAGLGAFLDLTDKTEARFMVFGALTAYLEDAESVAERISRLGDLLADDTPEKLVNYIDSFISDLLQSPQYWGSAFEPLESLAERIWALIRLVENTPPEVESETAAKILDLLALLAILRGHPMPLTRQALLDKLSELIELNQSLLKEDDPHAELTENQKLHSYLFGKQGKNSSGIVFQEKLLEALQLRVGRMIEYETLSDYLGRLPNDLQKLTACLNFYGFAVKAADREIIGNILAGLSDKWDVHQDLQSAGDQKSSYVIELKELFVEAKRVKLPDRYKDKLLEKIEVLAQKEAVSA